MKKQRKFPILLVLVAFLAGGFGGVLGIFLLNENTSSKVVEEKYYVEESQLINTIEKVMPSVVSIAVFRDADDFSVFDPFNVFGNKAEVAGGTGFIVSEDGLILTNKHVITGDGVKYYKVILNNGAEYDADFITEDPIDDIALIKIKNASGFPKVKFGNSDSLKIGQKVFAIGNALAQYGNTVTSGIISGTGREIFAFDDSNNKGENLSGLIQTDAAINFGNSGGPLVNLAGEVVGMNVAVAEMANSIGFAIPSNDLKPDLESVAKEGQIVRPILGVRFVMLNETQSKEMNLPVNYGAVILGGESLSEAGVVAGSSADQAGLKERDIILEVNGIRVDSVNPLHKIIRGYNPGDKVKLKIWRDGGEEEVSVKLKSSEG